MQENEIILSPEQTELGANVGASIVGSLSTPVVYNGIERAAWTSGMELV